MIEIMGGRPCPIRYMNCIVPGVKDGFCDREREHEYKKCER